MLLSLKYRFLFIHIAKTGGTSVRDSLGWYKWTDPYRLPQFLCSKISGLTGHRIGAKFPRHAKAIAALEMLPLDLYQQLFKFAFVRNPWDLQVSSYHHIRRERPDLMIEIPDFATFLRWKFEPSRPPQYHADMSTVVQHDYLVDLHGNLIVDYIGRYEYLAQDFQTACHKIGIAPPKLAHSRRAADRGKDYRTYFDDETAALIARHYQADCEHFGYCFDDPSACHLTGN